MPRIEVGGVVDGQDARRIPWKLFWAVVSALVALATASVPAAYGLDQLTRLLISGLGSAGLAVTFVQVTRLVVHRTPMFSLLLPVSKVRIVRWVSVAAIAHVVWVTAFAIRPDLWIVWVMALLVLAFVVYLVARAFEYLLTQVKPTVAELEARQAEAQAAAAAALGEAIGAGEVVESEVTRQVRDMLRRARKDWLTVLEIEEFGQPTPFGLAVKVRRPSQGAMAEVAATKNSLVKASAAELTPADAEGLAIALSEVLGKEILSDFVQIRKLPAAGTYLVTIVREDVMSRVYPYYEPYLAWTSITEPALVGYGMTGEPICLNLRQHGKVTGRSTSGKSSLIHVIIAKISSSYNALVWVCGVEKLYDLVAGWVEPFMDTDMPLPIDWIANGQEDTLQMLVAAMMVARWRQKAPLSERGNWPDIIVILDEASFALGNRSVRAKYQGQWQTASDMVANLLKGAASAGVFVIVASQRSTNEQWGDRGGEVTANVGWIAAFMSKDEAEIGREMGDFTLPMPRHRGQYWLDDGMGELPQQAKAPYIQSADPSKPKVSDGLTIADVALSRASLPQVRRGLDMGSARAAGEAYARRHTRMTKAMQNYLRGVDEDEFAGEETEAEEMPAVVNGPPVQPAPRDTNSQVTQPESGGDEPDLSGHGKEVYDQTVAQVMELRKKAEAAWAAQAADGPAASSSAPAGAGSAAAESGASVAVMDRPEPAREPEGEIPRVGVEIRHGGGAGGGSETRATWPRRVLDLLADRGRMSRAAIIDHFGQQYAQTLQNTLTRLFSEGRVRRENGEYWLPDGDSQSANTQTHKP